MRIRDITLTDIREGKNWKVVAWEDFDWESDPLESIPIAEATEFEPEDMIVYSAIFVTDGGEIKPLVMIKRVQDLDYGGDYCEFVDGLWRQVGLVPDPNAPLGKEFIANPLGQDDSFISDDDYRAEHRKGFEKFVRQL